MRRARSFNIEDASISGEIRRTLTDWIEELKFDSVKAGGISIVINELSSNILKHATRGEIICTKEENSLSIVAIDKGPGISDVSEALRDGFSTHGTAGNGLGAVKRLSDHFDLYTQPGKGTIVYSGFTREKIKDRFACFGFSIPLKGETVSGDGWSDIEGEIHKIVVADGLGHGVLAFEAASVANETFQSSTLENPLHEINQLHLALRSTRGAAVAVAYVDPRREILDFCGLGNIAGAVVNITGAKKLVSYNGTAGVQMRKVQSLPYPFPRNSVLVLHSDGLGSQWDLKDYPGILIKHPMIMASVLYRDFCRKTDDVTVVVGKFL